VARFEGHVAKFLGDGVLAFFGWPRAYEDQAERAVRSGLAAVEAVANLKTEDGQALEARVGIATGQVVIGDIVGEAATEADAVAGETPNLAARLQGLATPGQVVIGATTRLLIGEIFELKDLGTRELKGFAEPVHSWRVVREGDIDSRYEAKHVGGGLPLVGRQEELGLLLRSWEASKEGHGHVVLVQGEAGIGKSRLVKALCEHISGEDYIWVAVRCSPYHANSTLYPVIEHLKRVLGWTPEDGAEAKLEKLEAALQGQSLPLAEAVPLHAELMSLALPEGRYAPSGLSAKQKREQTLDAMSGWLLEMAERRPVLQVWEDLHWADPTTLELLALYIEQSPTVAMMNVLTYRPEFLPSWPMRSHMTPITLNRLERPEVEALIGHQAGGKQVPTEVIEHIIGKTDGVPLYVEELTKAILEANFLREQDGGYELTGPLSGVTIPATLQDSLMARLDRLPTIREVAQLGAVLGREFAYEMLQAIASLEETTLQEGLDRLVDAELLYQRGRRPRAKYIFKHALVQDAAYQSLLKRTRQFYHQQVAELLESRYPEIVQTQPELVARHYTEAGDPEHAISYWLEAGKRAVQRSANTEAVAHLSKGLELVETLPDSPERAEIELTMRVTLGPALMMARGVGAPEVAALYARATDLAAGAGDQTERFAAVWGQYYVDEIRGRWRDALDNVDTLHDIVGESADSGFLLQAHHAAWTANLFSGRLSAVQMHTNRGVELYDRHTHRDHKFLYGSHDPGVCVRVISSLSTTLCGYPDTARRHAGDALELAIELDHAVTLATAHLFGTIRSQMARDIDSAHEAAETTIELGSKYGLVSYIKMGSMIKGWSLAAGGHAEQGIEIQREVLDRVRARKNSGMAITYFYEHLAESLAAGGDHEGALAVVSDAFATAEAYGEHFWEAELHRRRGRILLAQSRDNRAAAEACYRQAIEVAKSQEARLLELRAATSLAGLWREDGKGDQARDLLAPVHGWFTEGFDTADLEEAKALLDELA
jgi:predicted ATPase